jgi:hypothetical protein
MSFLLMHTCGHEQTKAYVKADSSMPIVTDSQESRRARRIPNYVTGIHGVKSTKGFSANCPGLCGDNYGWKTLRNTTAKTAERLLWGGRLEFDAGLIKGSPSRSLDVILGSKQFVV